MAQPASRNPARTASIGAVLLLALCGAYFLTRPSPPASAPAPAPAESQRAEAPFLPHAPSAAPPSAPAPQTADSESLAQLREAQERLASYRRFARYPPGSRPAREHPDQMTPLAPVVRQLPLHFRGSANEEVRVDLGQDRRELVGDESARLWVRCEDTLGKVLPCGISAATAMPAPPTESKLAPVPVQFTDDGRSGDDRAGDGTMTTTLQPSLLGFRGYHGPVRVQLQLALAKEQGAVFFDLLYTPEVPARFTGKVRETLADGSLKLSLEMTVSRPGRYFVIGRIDDHRGAQVAYLEWNGELASGAQTVPLTVFGRLVHDERPEFPLALRDVQGFLFLEDSAPDRMHVPMLAGVAHKTQIYSLSDFAEAEWDSEQKRRYLEEYGKDVAAAEQRTPR